MNRRGFIKTTFVLGIGFIGTAAGLVGFLKEEPKMMSAGSQHGKPDLDAYWKMKENQYGKYGINAKFIKQYRNNTLRISKQKGSRLKMVKING